MDELGETDLRAGLHLLQTVSAAAADWQSFARAGVAALPALVASEITTLSVCDLRSGHRSVIGSPDSRLSAQDRASFDRHFDAHPLVQFHAHQRGQGARWRACDPALRRCRPSTRRQAATASSEAISWSCATYAASHVCVRAVPRRSG